MISKKLIKPERVHNETFHDYKQRRALANATIKKHLRGVMRWKAVTFLRVQLNDKGFPFTGQPGEVAARVTSMRKKLKGTLIYPYPRKVHGKGGSRSHRDTMFEQECSK